VHQKQYKKLLKETSLCILHVSLLMVHYTDYRGCCCCDWISCINVYEWHFWLEGSLSQWHL